MLQFLRSSKILSRGAEYLVRSIDPKISIPPLGTANLVEELSPTRTSADDAFSLAVCGEEEVPDFHEVGITDILTCVSSQRLVMRPNWPTLRNHLIVRCDDVEEPVDHYVCPSEEHVRQIIEFGEMAIRRSNRGIPVRLLIHCAAGISRSTATALLILSMKYGSGAETRAMEQLTSLRPQCRPNGAIVRLGDRLLQREGRLVHEVTAWKMRIAAA